MKASDDIKHTSLVKRCWFLLSEWEAFKAVLSDEAAKDRKAGLVWTAEAQNAAQLTIKGCIAGLKEVLEEETGEDKA